MNENKTNIQKTLSNAADSLAIALSSMKLSKEIIDNNEQPAVSQIKNDINYLIDTIHNQNPKEIISANAYIVKNYPEIFTMSGGVIQPVSINFIEQKSVLENIYTLHLMKNCLCSIKGQKQDTTLQMIAKKAGQAVLEHFAAAAINALCENATPKKE